ncbi:MAG: NAD(+)/NADH kinase [Erysipelotrichaceae bacterium]|nr:NAD(+)/NADH kinase [Erysipelotrichaceae bacterium]
MKEIKSVQLFANPTAKSEKIKEQLLKELNKKQIEVCENADLCIAIGGDGSFLHMIHQTNFDTSCMYVGLHAGTLGFLQELSVDEIPTFLDCIKCGEYYSYPMDIQKTVITDIHGETHTLLSINEVVVRKSNLKALKANVYIDNHLLEFFAGDGLLVSTSVGSTAYNMSFGGSLVDSSLQTMQLTPIAPLINCHYHNLQNSLVLPDTKKIMYTIDDESLVITVDGQNTVIDHVCKVEVEILKEKLSCIYYRKIDTATKIREKLIKE